MKEFFVYAHSFAAPFFSDSSHEFMKANSAQEAMDEFREDYNHPCGLFAAAVYRNADAYHKNRGPLLRWLSKEAHIPSPT